MRASIGRPLKRTPSGNVPKVAIAPMNEDDLVRCVEVRYSPAHPGIGIYSDGRVILAFDPECAPIILPAPAAEILERMDARKAAR